MSTRSRSEVVAELAQAQKSQGSLSCGERHGRRAKPTLSARKHGGRFRRALEIVLGALLLLAWALVIAAIDAAMPSRP